MNGSLEGAPSEAKQTCLLDRCSSLSSIGLAGVGITRWIGDRPGNRFTFVALHVFLKLIGPWRSRAELSYNAPL